MEGRSRSRKPIPGAFPGASSRGSSSESSESGSTSNVTASLIADVQKPNGALTNAQVHDSSLEHEAEGHVTPKNAAQKTPKRRRSLGVAPAVVAPATEFGVVAATADAPEDDTSALTPRAKGKGKAKASTTVASATPTARLVIPKPPARSTTHASSSRHYVEISSDTEALPDAMVISALKREIASLKKQLATAQQQQHKKKDSTSSNPSELIRMKEELAKEQAQVQALQLSNKQFRETVRSGLLCGICDELLYQPWALSPCGHVYCLPCLQSWFNPEADEDDEGAEVKGNKTCPDCRAKIRLKPIQVFIIKSLVEMIHPNPASIPVPPSPATENPADPWDGVFSEPGNGTGGDTDLDDDDDEDEDEYAPASEVDLHLGDDYCECGEGDTYDDEGYCRFCGLHEPPDDDDDDDDDEPSSDEHEGARRMLMNPAPYRTSLHQTLSSSTNWGAPSVRNWGLRGDEEDSNTDDDVSESDSESGSDSPESAIYILPSPTPPCLDLDPQSNTHLQPSQLELCNRGVPYDMIRRYNVRYHSQRGICAQVGRNHTLWLGWNLLDIEDTDTDGSRWVASCLRDIESRTEEWKVMPAANGGWTAFRLILQGGAEDFGHWEDPDD
ncbi:hypothetical protein FRB95_003297 [Tulasnella sp. JGI-2019a]|nr:hypothetical protein FRB95_003297 [Tulasnella sp. JGI-2019a]